MNCASGNCDLAIVGGGVVGVMMALLAKKRRPDLQVAIFDRGLVGGGATNYSAFLDMPYGVTAGIRELSLRSQVLLGDFEAYVPDFPLQRLPMRVVAAPTHREGLQERLTQPMEPDQAPENPAIAPRGFALPEHQVVLGIVRAARYQGDGLVAKFVQALLRQEGVWLVEGAQVCGLSTHGDCQQVVLSDGRKVDAQKTAICTGPWLSQTLLELLHFELEARVKCVAAMLLPEAPSPGAVVTYLFDDDAFFLPQPERHRWLFSFRAEQWDVDPNRPLGLTKNDFARAASLLERCFPGGYPQPLGCRVFCDAYSANRDPFIEIVAPGVVAAGAAGGSGVRLGPAMAEQALKRLGLSADQ